MIPTPEAQQQAREVLQEILLESTNPVLSDAVSQAASGILARAGVIISAAQSLLHNLPAISPPSCATLLRIESILREIDGGFAKHELPKELKQIREQLINVMEQTDPEIEDTNKNEPNLATS